MAAAPGASAPESPPPVAVAEFLAAAAELHRALASLHRDIDGQAAVPAPEAGLDVLSARLGKTTEALGPADAGSLTGACRRVGRELCLRLGRLRDSGAVDAAGVRNAWSSRDVEALGARLRGLAGRCSDEAVSPE